MSREDERTVLPDPQTVAVPEGIDRRASMMRSAAIGAVAPIARGMTSHLRETSADRRAVSVVRR